MTVDRKIPILIVDDYKTMLRIIRNLLRQLDFQNVAEASDGASALQLRTRQAPARRCICSRSSRLTA